MATGEFQNDVAIYFPPFNIKHEIELLGEKSVPETCTMRLREF